MAHDFEEDVRKRLAGALEALAIEKGCTVEELTAAAAEVLCRERGEARSVDASSDARTVNNTARQAYRVLSAREKAQCDSIRELGSMFIGLLHEIGGTDPDGDRQASRNLSLAQTHVEDAVMRAVRHVTA